MPTPSSPSSSSPDAPGGRLDGWKEIAAYLGRSVRTVQRWESLYKLPVYRMGTGRGENVHAFERELDAWLASIRWTRRDDGSASGSDREPEGPPGASSDGAPTGSASASAQAATGHEGVAAEPAAQRRPVIRGWRLWLAGAGVLAAAALAGVFLIPRPAPLQPSTFKIDGNTLRVYDVNGRQVFAYPSPTGLLKAARYTQPWPPFVRRIVFEDIDGDGSLETVLLRPTGFDQDDGASELVCLDAHGKVRFTLRTTDSVQFGDRMYAPPWGGASLFVTGPRSRRQLWVAWVHIESGQFPCLLERIDDRGKPVSKYWSAGYVDLVASGVLAGVPSIFVGAANNDHTGASLAAFPENDVNGSAPAEQPDKVCRSCPPGGPTAFLVFPRMELQARTGHLPYPALLNQQATGDFRLLIEEGSQRLNDTKIYQGTAYYELSPNLTPIRAGFNSEYVASHHEAERDKYVDHPFGEVDYRQLWPVLVWKDGKFVPVVGQTDR